MSSDGRPSVVDPEPEWTRFVDKEVTPRDPYDPDWNFNKNHDCNDKRTRRLAVGFANIYNKLPAEFEPDKTILRTLLKDYCHYDVGKKAFEPSIGEALTPEQIGRCRKHTQKYFGADKIVSRPKTFPKIRKALSEDLLMALVCGQPKRPTEK